MLYCKPLILQNDMHMNDAHVAAHLSMVHRLQAHSAMHAEHDLINHHKFRCMLYS